MFGVFLVVCECVCVCFGGFGFCVGGFMCGGRGFWTMEFVDEIRYVRALEFFYVVFFFVVCRLFFDDIVW